VFPLNLYARVRLFMCNWHTRPRVQRAPGLPCVLSLGGQGSCKPRAKHAARMRIHVQPSLRAKRSNPESRARLWIASSLTLLAMTGVRSSARDSPHAWSAPSSTQPGSTPVAHYGCAGRAGPTCGGEGLGGEPRTPALPPAPPQGEGTEPIGIDPLSPLTGRFALISRCQIPLW
jgi:hypothetical protein